MKIFNIKKSGGFVFLYFLLGFVATSAHAFGLLPGTNFLSYTPLDSWSFTNGVTSDHGYAPVSYTNLSLSYLGDGTALVVDSTNPAWLQYNVVESTGATNLAVDVGTVCFWYAPDWASVNQGGAGPGEAGRLLEAGGYTPDSSFGLWSIYVDAAGDNLSFSAQTNDLSGNFCTYVSAPIAFTTNYWHFIALTYSTTNTLLYIDGVLANNGPPITNYPGPAALANGFFLGSDSNGIYQAHGMIDDVATYNVPVDGVTIGNLYGFKSFDYRGNPFNQANIKSGGSYPATNNSTPHIITGSGFLQPVGTVACNYASTNTVWMTNVTGTVVGGTVNVTFTISGGLAGFAYDVFAIGTPGFPMPLTNSVWAWMGQGYACNTYTLPISGSTSAYIILGTPQDQDLDGLTDAYELLVSKTSPNSAMSNSNNIPDGWNVLLGLYPQTNNIADSTKRVNYGYTGADWLNGVTGSKSGAISPDAEGNVTSVSQ